MSTDTSQKLAPIALAPAAGEALWFMGGLTTIKAGGEQTAGRVAVTEQLAPRGSGSPLHVHHREDEWFYVIEGELTFWVGGETVVAPAGSFVYGPRDVPHTFIVSSEQARFLLVVEPAGFEDFVRALSTPAERPEIPPPSSEPPDLDALVAVAASYGIDIVGPPGIPG
jgi:quercetin dioxygenase-like cupin family protein